MIYYFRHAQINEWVGLDFVSRTKGKAQIIENNGVYEGIMLIKRENKAQQRHTIIELTVTESEVTGKQTFYVEKYYQIGRATTILKSKERVIEQIKGYNAEYHDFSKKDIEKVVFFLGEMQGELERRNHGRAGETV